MIKKTFKNAIFSEGGFTFDHYGDWQVVFSEKKDSNIHLLLATETDQQCCEEFDIIELGEAKHYRDGDALGSITIVACDLDDFSHAELEWLSSTFAEDAHFKNVIDSKLGKGNCWIGSDEFNQFFMGIWRNGKLVGGYCVSNWHNGYYWHGVWCTTEKGQSDYMCYGL